MKPNLAKTTVMALATLLTVAALKVSSAQRPLPKSEGLQQQTDASSKVEFDVASVKPNKGGGRATSNVPLRPGVVAPPTGGLFSATNMPLIAYIAFAYNLTSAQFVRLQSQLPEWATSDGFDIEARTEGNPSRERMQLMMQSLLADRFRLASHVETREDPVYALTLARPGRTGPQLQQATEPCSTAPSSVAPNGTSTTTPKESSPHVPDFCGMSTMQPSEPGLIRVGGRSVTMGMIAISFTSPVTGVDRPVVDRSGLNGNFDFTIEFAPAQPLRGTFPAATQDNSGPLFMEALQEQLGLKLVPQTGPVDVLVIDHVEEPSAN